MHDEAFTQIAKGLFPKFSRFKGFYLVGGTALALQIGHRRSVDFDFFSSEKLPPRLLQQVKRVFSGSQIELTYRAPEQINLTLDSVKTTFFNYPYPPVDKLIDYKGVPMASVREIAAMKALSIGQRLSYKDYVDWYFLLKEKYATLAEVIDLAKKKFNGDFNDRLFLGQLVYFDDIKTQEIDFLRDKTGREVIEEFLTQEVKNFMR